MGELRYSSGVIADIDTLLRKIWPSRMISACNWWSV